ncbi:hypothetical protein [Alkalibacillus salilacus]|uniref:ABC-type transport system involved in multi-copper enzyme maturation permease subunit n=1 Tax=Alkalibacillus salilacus TaxID=284582 RepID=A0ABT9VIM3_9BACI|nr:hypothetical protein [Alkalibacillus salilacus]MDQ0160807.1 ABC-type transport system involved in multi-copper enzyme maturation permease subunit [Alkalibacillus salilacus]
MESNLERNKLILEKEVKPIFPTGFSTTVYDQFDSERSQEAAEMKAEKFSASALYFQKKLSDMAFNALGVLFLILIVVDITTKEGFRKDGPINLLYTQPINQLSLFLNKFMAGVIIILITLSSVMIISTALGFIFDRFGDWNFPILRYEEGELYSFINLGTYLVQALTLFVCILIFSFTIYFLMSLMTNHLLVGLMCTLVIYLLGSGMTEIAFFADYAQWNPFSYYSVASIVTQEQAAISGNWELTFRHGTLTLSLSSLVILTIMLAFLQFKKKISL